MCYEQTEVHIVGNSKNAHYTKIHIHADPPCSQQNISCIPPQNIPPSTPLLSVTLFLVQCLFVYISHVMHM